VYQSAIDALLAQARAVLDRVEPGRLDDELAAGAVLIDIRPVEQRQRDGELTGAIIIDRNVLEWRLDPTSPDRLPVASSADIRYILVCNQGYSSSLAAATLRDLGLSRGDRPGRWISGVIGLSTVSLGPVERDCCYTRPAGASRQSWNLAMSTGWRRGNAADYRELGRWTAAFDCRGGAT
jgi:rhodanese-related sulfurtransferase